MTRPVEVSMSEFPIHILVDARPWEPTEIVAGPWLVADLKRHAGVPAHKVLARIDPFSLTDLDDDETIEVEDGMRFMSHVRTGASS